MGGFDFEEPDYSKLLKETALEAMRNTLMSSEEKITLVPLGPLTNIALLITTYPEVCEKIKEIILMGGALGRGNCGVLSEFNFHADPEAARIIMQSQLKITIPYILVDSYFENLDTNKVYFDNIDGAQQAITLLAEHGYKKMSVSPVGMRVRMETISLKVAMMQVYKSLILISVLFSYVMI